MSMFNDYLREEFEKNPSLKEDVELAGILLDVQINYYRRIEKGDSTPGGFEKEFKKIKEWAGKNE